MGEPEALLAGRYRLLKVIATGGMGVVWEAWDERLERSVAIKQLHALPGVPDDEAELAKERAMREARITARLHHPHAVPVFDAVEHDGQPCLIMQLLPSTPLSSVIRDSGPLPLGQVARIGSEVASALSAAHELGIIHRDVKPGNILITPDGGAHISDFGISHAMGDATLTRTGMIHGTPAYLAPEVARGEDASFPADVFSLGSTLYAALEGAPPFGMDGNSIALLHKVAAAQLPPPTRAGSLTPFLLEMLASEPGERPTMEVVARSLADLDTGDPSLAVSPTVPLAPVPAGSTSTPEPHDIEVQEHREPVVPDVDEIRRRRRASPWVVLLGAGIVAALAWVMVASLNDDPSGGGAAGDRTATTETTPTSPSPSSDQPTPTTAAPTTASPTSATPTASATGSAAPNLATRLSAAITDYYALLPDDTSGAWPLMTADYQTGTSGGRSSYERFWGAIRDVTVTDVRATPPDRVVATITYSRDSGRVDIERTSYRLVDEGGVLKIAASQVLSSRRG
ncbi:serine/threonine protein kinase [Knoellia locipacati]|uniref:serine/threonine-protein kinase n=1 Tax=Knoellia locipacati TaxID=882824 RepID=UPI00384D5AEA